MENKLNAQGEEAQDGHALQYMQDYYQNQYIALQRSLQNASEALAEMRETKESVENISKISGKGILSSIGSGMMIKAQAEKIEYVVVGVGAGFYVEKDVQDAQAYIAASINTQEGLIKRLVEAQDKVKRAIIETASKIDNLG